MDGTETAWDNVSHVVSSHYRDATLTRLADGPAPPSRIADDTDMRLAHVSRALQELSDADLAELLVSEERKKGRVYGITDHGIEVQTLIDTENVM